MKSILVLLSFLGLVTISGCDSEPPKSKIKNPLAGQVDALKKAKEVEGILKDAAEKQRKSIDDMTQ